ncbi:MAG TPA: EamA family transporter, partial [Bacillota bacterium]|nr:EamA family transporter [Bacillota bacterium]
MFNSKHLALLSYLTVCIVWGSTYLAIRVGVTDMPFLIFAGIRFSAAGILLLIISRLKGWAFPPGWRDYRAHILIGMLLLFVCNGLTCWAEQYLDSSLTALLGASLPLFTAAIENLLPREQRTGLLNWVGLFIGFGGVAVLVSPQFRLKGNTWPAIVGVLCSSVIWAAGSIYLNRNPIRGAMIPGVGIQMLSAGVVFLLLSAFSGNFTLSDMSASGLAALLYLIFFGSILAYSSFYYMIKVTPPAKAGTYAYINPLVAMILGVLILKENLTMQSIVAALVILGG